LIKILAVIGSPRGKGQGSRIVEKVEKKMKRLGKLDFEYLFLKDADLKLCRGFFYVFQREGNFAL